MPDNKSLLTNADIARLLAEIGALLEIKGENPFKIRAYQRAAETIAGLPHNLHQLRQQEQGLRTISGVGQAIAQKIEELLDTGRMAYYDELLAEIPASVLELLRLPGLGPKKIKTLIERAGIVTIDQLENAARQGQLRNLPGMGAKTEQDLLQNISRLREYNKRTNLGLAWEIAQNIINQLRECAPIDQLIAAGSLRRMRETIGDIDLLATSQNPEAVMECFINLQLVASILAHGPTKSSILTVAGLQADLRVVSPDSYGAALQYFTGSKQHNIKLRDLAVHGNIKLNEYRAVRIIDGKEEYLGGRTEEEMYAALGLPFIAPELREDQGEIEAARRGELPHLVTIEQIKGDLHTHSNWSDGRNSIEEMARAARAAGYEYLAICDHSPSQTIANGLSIDRLRQRRREIEAARKALPSLTILEGAEVDIKRDGRLDYPDEVLAELDFVIASVHSGWKSEREAMTERVLKALHNPWVDCLGHPTGRLIGQREPFAIDLDAVFRTAAELGVALEISSDPNRLDLKDSHARRAKELGAKFIVSTDAHAATQFDIIRFGIATARRGWIETSDVLNILPLDELRASLRRSRAR